MKCSECGREVKVCECCHDEFEKGQDLLCYQGEWHYCDESCLLSDQEVFEGEVE